MRRLSKSQFEAAMTAIKQAEAAAEDRESWEMSAKELRMGVEVLKKLVIAHMPKQEEDRNDFEN